MKKLKGPTSALDIKEILDVKGKGVKVELKIPDATIWLPVDYVSFTVDDYGNHKVKMPRWLHRKIIKDLEMNAYLKTKRADEIPF